MRCNEERRVPSWMPIVIVTVREACCCGEEWPHALDQYSVPHLGRSGLRWSSTCMRPIYSRGGHAGKQMLSNRCIVVDRYLDTFEWLAIRCAARCSAGLKRVKGWLRCSLHPARSIEQRRKIQRTWRRTRFCGRATVSDACSRKPLLILCGCAQHGPE